MDDAFYRRLSDVFTAAQIIELGFMCPDHGRAPGFIHTLDPYGTGTPVIPYSPDQVDRVRTPSPGWLRPGTPWTGRPPDTTS